MPKIITVNKHKNEEVQNAALLAVEVLKQGGVIIFPTETVYGLGADIQNSRAIDRIYSIKNAQNHFLII